MSDQQTTNSTALQIAYDILAPTGCNDFQEHLKRSTKLIDDALHNAFEKGYVKRRNETL